MAGLENLGEDRAKPFGKDNGKNHHTDDDKDQEKNASAAITAVHNAGGYADQRAVGSGSASAARASDRAEAQGFDDFNRSNAQRKKESYAAKLGDDLAQHASEPGTRI